MLVWPVGPSSKPGRSHRWADTKHWPGAGCETCCWSGQRRLLRVSLSEKGRGQFRATSFLYFLRQMDRIQIDKREGIVSSCFSFTSSWLVRWWTPDHCLCCGFSFLSSSSLAFSVNCPAAGVHADSLPALLLLSWKASTRMLSFSGVGLFPHHFGTAGGFLPAPQLVACLCGWMGELKPHLVGNQFWASLWAPVLCIHILRGKNAEWFLPSIVFREWEILIPTPSCEARADYAPVSHLRVVLHASHPCLLSSLFTTFALLHLHKGHETPKIGEQYGQYSV